MPIYSTQIVRLDGLMLAASIENSAVSTNKINMQDGRSCLTERHDNRKSQEPTTDTRPQDEQHVRDACGH
jgi:hypothetical protein